MQGPDYKKKYLELRSKYINDLDMAFRLGVEQGMQNAQQEQALDAQAQRNDLDAQNAAGGQPQPGQPGEQPEQSGSEEGSSEQPEQNPGMEAQGQGSELDHHINTLEGMLGKDSSPEVQKSLQAILSLRKAEKLSLELKKSQTAISGIAKALHKPSFKLGVQASHNLEDNAKKSVTMQHKIVNDIMKSWDDGEKKAASQIEAILNVEGILKG